MSSITIENLDESLRSKLLLRATRSGHSIQEEIQLVLQDALAQEETPQSLGEIIHQRFALVGGFDLPEVHREAIHDRLLFEDSE